MFMRKNCLKSLTPSSSFVMILSIKYYFFKVFVLIELQTTDDTFSPNFVIGQFFQNHYPSFLLFYVQNRQLTLQLHLSFFFLVYVRE